MDALVRTLLLTLSLVIGVARGTDALPWCYLQYRGTVISLLYYYYFFRLIHFDSDRAFYTYAKFAFWFAVIALPLWAGTCIAAGMYVRLKGLATEPAQFCVLVLPAYYWYADRFLTSRKNAVEVAVLSLAVALSMSSLGYLSVAFGIVLLLSERRRALLVAPFIACALLGLTYATSPYFRLRADKTLIAAYTGDLSTTLGESGTQDITGSSLSAYSLISNALVTADVLRESPLFGNGLGSHPVSHARFLAYLGVPDFFSENHIQNLNQAEAGSLTLRVLSEFGLIGFLGVLVFVFHFHVGGRGARAAISNGILTCFFLKLIRSGEYYQPEQFFFIFIYILNYWKWRDQAAPARNLLLRQGPLTEPRNDGNGDLVSQLD